jgi:hypothetical protein
MDNYDIILSDVRGAYLARLNNISALNMVRTENQIGTLTLTMPVTRKLVQTLRPDLMVDVMRYHAGRWNLVGDTHFLLRKWKFDNYNATLDFNDGISLLDRRVVAYASGDSVPQSHYTARVSDEAMKFIVEENYGALAVDANRNIMDYLHIQPVGNAGIGYGVILDKDFSGSRVLSVIQELSKTSFELGVYVGFDVVAYGPGKFEFRTYIDKRGVDHSYPNGSLPILFSSERDNLAAGASLTYDHTTERNFVYARGTEVGGVLMTGTAQDNRRIKASPFNRMEDWVTTQSSTTDAADKDAEAILGEGRPRILFEGTAMQTAGCLFGIHYGFGDLVSAEAYGVTLTCRVRTFNLSLGANGEAINVVLSNTDVP